MCLTRIEKFRHSGSGYQVMRRTLLGLNSLFREEYSALLGTTTTATVRKRVYLNDNQDSSYITGYHILTNKRDARCLLSAMRKRVGYANLAIIRIAYSEKDVITTGYQELDNIFAISKNRTMRVVVSKKRTLISEVTTCKKRSS